MSLLNASLTSVKSSLWVVLMVFLFSAAIACFWIAGVESALMSQDLDDESETISNTPTQKLSQMGLREGDTIVSMKTVGAVTHISLLRNDKALKLQYREALPAGDTN